MSTVFDLVVITICCKTTFRAPVAQLDRALPSEGRGQRFESSRVRQLPSFKVRGPWIKQLFPNDYRSGTGVCCVMVWVRSPVYFYRRNETFYFSRAVPSDLCHRFNKKKIEVSLRTKSEAKAAKSAEALSDRLERYWDSLRMEMIYSRVGNECCSR